MRVLLVITAMGCGGAERRIAWLAKRLSGFGHHVVLGVLHGRTSHFEIDDRVDLRFCEEDHPGVSTAPARFLGRLRWLRHLMAEASPNVVLSFIDVANATTLWAARSFAVPVVVAERVHPPAHAIPAHYRLMRRLLYPSAAAVVVQTEETAHWARKWLAPERISVIPNPVVRPMAPANAPDDTSVHAKGRWLVAMGRLERQKGFDLLIAAFDIVARNHGDWRLAIVGDGGERAALEHDIHRRGLGKRVLMLGSIEDPEHILRACEMFVLSSRYEGFPNALCEAMASGLPVISFDCPTGPRDIIRDRIDGVLVPAGDVAALAAAIGHLIENPDKAARLAARGPEVIERFNEGEVFTRWEELLEATASGRVDSGRGRG